MLRSWLRLLSLALLTIALTVPLASTAQAKPFPDQIDLPAGFRPEGITIGKRATAYLGSLANGNIYAVSLRTGEGSIVSTGLGPAAPSVGLKVDNRGRLFVAGGPSGAGRVIDVRTGDIIQTYPFTAAPAFINDVVLTRTVAWFTDSLQAQLYGVPLGPGGPGGTLGDPSDVITLPLTGDWEQQDGFNANGIAETPDRRALLVIQSNTGLLFRVDPSTGEATLVDLGGELLPNGDGLLVRGTTLYVVQNQLNQVAVIELDAAGTSGTLVETLTSADFDVPTTVAALGNSLYLPNARFNTAPTPTTRYWITRIDR